MKKDEKEALQRLSLTKDWEIFERWLRRICYVDNDIFSTDSLDVAYKLGRRSVFLLIDAMKEIKNG